MPLVVRMIDAVAEQGGAMEYLRSTDAPSGAKRQRAQR
jgi:hypothetical protein